MCVSTGTVSRSGWDLWTADNPVSTWRRAGDGVILKPERFNECLGFLRWSQIDLAAALECDIFLVNAWANGIEAIPDDIAAWLNKLAKAHAKAAIPESYKGVRLKMKIEIYRRPDSEAT